jgi:hypothetical protein
MLRMVAICVVVIVLAALRSADASAQATSNIVVMLGGYGEVVTHGYSCTVADFESGACPPLAAPIGSTLTFTANPASITAPDTGGPVPVPSSFVGWSRPECEGMGPCTMAVEDDEEAIVAHFSPVWLELLVSGNDNAATTVAVSGQPHYCTTADCTVALFDAGTRLDVTATPPPTPSEWAFGCDPFDSDLAAGRCAIETSNIRNFVSLALAGTEPDQPPFDLRKPVTVKRRGSGNGRVQGAGTDASGTNWSIDCGTDCRLRGIQYQTRIRLRASAASGSTFQRWAGPPCGGRTVCTFTAGKYPTVRATFSRNSSASVASSPSSPSSSSPSSLDPGPARPGSVPFSVSVSRATASGRRAKRRIVVRLTTNRSARATLRLTRKRKRIAIRTFALSAGTSTLRAKVPRRTPAGWYRMSLVLTAADGTRKSFSKRLRLRR